MDFIIIHHLHSSGVFMNFDGSLPNLSVHKVLVIYSLWCDPLKHLLYSCSYAGFCRHGYSINQRAVINSRPGWSCERCSAQQFERCQYVRVLLAVTFGQQRSQVMNMNSCHMTGLSDSISCGTWMWWNVLMNRKKKVFINVKTVYSSLTDM